MVESTKFGESSDLKVPESCCKGIKAENTVECQKEAGSSKYKMEGCLSKLKDDISNNKAKVLGVAVTILVVMVGLL